MAEMPFIATSWSYRNQGMSKKLMAGIESVRELDVKFKRPDDHYETNVCVCVMRNVAEYFRL